MIDFEYAVKKALEMHFVGIEIKGCGFHFAQCLERKIQELKLQHLVRNEQYVEDWFRMHIGMCMVPHQNAEKIYKNFTTYFKPPVPAGYEFNDYFMKNWIKSKQFPPLMWTHFWTGLPRTNNHTEGYNNRLNRRVGCSKNIYHIIEVLIQEQSNVELDKMQGDVFKRRKIYDENVAIIQKLRVDYLMVNIHEFAYLKSVGYRLKGN